MLDQDHIRWLNRIQNGTVETHITNSFIDKLKEERLILAGKDKFFLSKKGKELMRA